LIIYYSHVCFRFHLWEFGELVVVKRMAIVSCTSQVASSTSFMASGIVNPECKITLWNTPLFGFLEWPIRKVKKHSRKDAWSNLEVQEVTAQKDLQTYGPASYIQLPSYMYYTKSCGLCMHLSECETIYYLSLSCMLIPFILLPQLFFFYIWSGLT